MTDINGVSLDLPNPPYGDGINAPTMIFDPVIPENTLSEATGFGAEAFFYLAESAVPQSTGGKALLVLGIEAAYGAGDPDPLVPRTSSSLPGSGSASTPSWRGPIP